MKKKIFLKLGLIANASVITLPFIAASCNKTDDQKTPKKPLKSTTATSLEEAKHDYRAAYTEYNKEIKTFADQLQQYKKELASDKVKKDQTKKSLIEASVEKLYKDAKTKLDALEKEYNAKFEIVRKLEKEQNAKIRTVRIFHTNDEHGRIKFDDYKYNLYSGMIGTDKFIKTKKRDLLLSAGDLIQGLPLSDSDKGKSIAKIAKNMGYDSVAVGNHEFDYGLNHIKSLDDELNKDQAQKMPFLSANIYYKDFSSSTDKPEGYDQNKVGQRVFTPYIVKTLESGLKVAVFGITTPDTTYTSHPKNSALVEFKDPTEESIKVMKEIKQAHPDIKFVIATTHLGVQRNQSTWSSEYLVKNVNKTEKTELDLVLDGHSHTYVEANNSSNSDIYVTQTEAYTKWLGDIEVEFNTETGKIERLSQVLRNIWQIDVATHNQPKDETSSNAKLLAALEAEFEKEKSQPAFKNTKTLLHAQNVEIDGTPHWVGRVKPTGLGIMAANALVWDYIRSKPENVANPTPDNTIGLMNGGGLRVDLTEGDLNKGHLLALSPFGNRITAIKVKGSKLIDTLKHGLSKGKSGGFAQLSSNVSYDVDVVKEKDAKLDKLTYVWKPKESSFKINGKNIVADQDYYIVTNDFIAAGGDGYKMLDLTKEKDISLAFEGGKLIDSIIAYGQHITKDGTQLKEELFEKKIDAYSTEEIKANQKVNIPTEAFTNIYKDPKNS
ncbi:5'-nucleotidase [Mycoplasmopsis californica HAZ160_1]|uniref:5'-nucleotidase n=1 Tax=Mycoplasmopsis californica HAZ160_1 TaxID=1397850 RepID=A0AAT9F8B8_9BACT|nr:5'-nucleotidase C-terminal domain-containing protein [Mycoplasmopsis californica]BAP01153.1 5'-nucleotidase [Mycoplasmopsis californica HAZ160_1]BBG41019.1 5'-nucleotidase [Mycoplasmopsis californica]BBG41612.1 5'-nucleotidase [Mycoplasmopsis californica]BBG42206.1 5'-nucleotidase [Mycoplasmopsis californica]BBG42788.1 5'-nucleotidase [Mycoplasmopsis californica]